MTPPNVSPSRDNSLPRGMLGNTTPVGGRLAVWLIDSSPMLDSLQKDLKQISQNITQLAKILDQMSSMSVTGDSEVTIKYFCIDLRSHLIDQLIFKTCKFFFIERKRWVFS